MTKIISSLQNDLIKNVVKLNKAGERRKQNLIIIEGYREINLGIQAGFKLEVLIYCSKFLKFQVSSFKFHDTEIVEVTEEVFSKIAYRESSDGMIALAKPRYLKLDEIVLSDNPLIIIIEKVEKPGNLGAILRTADAAKADAVIICDNQTDIYNPNTIRSSLGTIFTNQIACCSNEEAYEWLKKNKIKSFATSLKAEKMYYSFDFRKSSAIVMGSEANGLSDSWHKNSDELIKIPMGGKVDSLNVSVSTAIVVFEAVRQRLIRN
jgi:RNA methyltransferase, TrmH family